jgi:acetoin utilization deacetylase AcuC-like enzyme
VYADVIEKLLDFGKPILAVGGGGYNMENTVRAWSLAWAALCEDDSDRQSELRDGPMMPEKAHREAVEAAVVKVIEVVKKNIFGHHGL